MADEQQGTQQQGGKAEEHDRFSDNPQKGGTSQGQKDSGEGIGPDDADEIVNAGEG